MTGRRALWILVLLTIGLALPLQKGEAAQGLGLTSGLVRCLQGHLAVKEQSNAQDGAGISGVSQVTAAVLAPSPQPGLYDIDSVDCEAADVLKGLARRAGVNLIVPSSATNRITIELHQVTVEDAVKYITRLSGLDYVNENGTYIIGNGLAKDAESEMVAGKAFLVTTYRANHVTCSQLAEAISKIFADDQLTLATGPEPIAPRLDETQTSSVTGVAAAALSAASEEAAAHSQVLILSGPEDIVSQALDLCRELDRPAKQITVDVTITDVSRDALKELGISWTWNPIQIREETPDSVIKFGKLTRASASIEGVLAALAQKGDAHLLANPSVSVLDGQKAFVLIGDRLLFPVLTGYTQAMTPIFDKAEERVGIYLQVAPRVADDGTITMTIYPQVSVVTDYLEINGASYPQISTREAQTTIRVRNGEKIAIGGLIRDEEVTQLKKVPGLSEIPLFGELFKSRRKVHQTSEVVIFLTPTIVDDKAEAASSDSEVKVIAPSGAEEATEGGEADH
jgi:type II secretory pathway component HofQ